MKNSDIFDGLCYFDLPQIQIDKKTIDKYISWAEACLKKKQTEANWKFDGGKGIKRLVTGKLGELAIEQYLGIKFSDDTIGESQLFNRADLSQHGVKCGVKTSNWGGVPLVSESPKHSELIVILRKNKYDFEFGDNCIIFGLATKEVLKKYSSFDLTIDKRAATKKSPKKGFYGFEHLIEVSSIDEIRRLEK